MASAMISALVSLLVVTPSPKLEPVLVTSKQDQTKFLIEVLEANDPLAEAKNRKLIVKDGDKFRFYIEANCWPEESIRAQRTFINALQKAIGTASSQTLAISSLDATERSATRDVLASMITSLDPGMRPLIESEDLKVSYQASITSTFRSQGKTLVLSVNRPHVDQTTALSSKQKPSDAERARSEKALNERLLGLKSAPLKQINFVFPGPQRQSQQLSLFEDYAKVLEPLKIELEQCESARAELKRALIERGFGEPVPEKGSFSQLPKAFRDALIQDARASYRSNGFGSADEAEAWIQTSQMTFSNSYVSIGLGGWDSVQNQVVFGFFPLEKP